MKSDTMNSKRTLVSNFKNMPYARLDVFSCLRLPSYLPLTKRYVAFLIYT